MKLSINFAHKNHW